MTNRQLHRRDDSETGCRAINIVSYLEAANEKLRQSVAELMHETAALRQELKKRKAEGGLQHQELAGGEATTIRRRR